MNRAGDFRSKYRPKKFSDIVGNERIVKYLKRTIHTGRIPQGVLFHGEAGSGKTSLAYLYARALTCENYQDDACGTCDACHYADRFFPGGPIAGTCIYDCTYMNEQILDDAIMRGFKGAFSGRFGLGIHIFDEFHRVKERTQDRFLKLSEDDPYKLFIFCLIELTKVDKALAQRLTLLRTERPRVDQLAYWLAGICRTEGIKVKDQEALKYLASQAHRVPRACLGILQKLSCYGEPLTINLVNETADDEVSLKNEGGEILDE